MTEHDHQPGSAPHSNEPRVAASQWLTAELQGRPAPAVLVVLGLGEGHLLDVLEDAAPATRVLAIEPDPSAAGRFSARRDWSAWTNPGRLIRLVDPDYAGAESAWRMLPASSDDYKVLIAPAVRERGGEAAVRAARVLKRVLYDARGNADARRRFAPRYLTNSLRNLPALTAGSDVRALRGVYQGIPAVIAAAGPSLDAALPALADIHQRGVLIATDTALRPLLHAGIAPPLVVGVDPGERNARHFDGLPDREDTWLVAETALDPGAARQFGDRTFWFRVAEHHPWPWFQSQGIDVGLLEVWGSVLTAAFQVAVLAGCDPIVFAGADLSFTGGRPYARGTTYEFDWAYSAAIGEDLQRAWDMQMAMREPVPVVDLDGAPAVTTAPLQAFRDWMVVHTVKSGRRIINATGAGIFFGPGIEQMPLATALVTHHRVPRLDAIDRKPPCGATRSALDARCHDVLKAIAAEPPASPELTQWIEFTSGGCDAGAIAAALEDARAELTGASSSGAVDSPVVPASTRAMDLAASYALVSRLPESIARLRMGLVGGPAAASGAEAAAEAGSVAPGADLLAEAARRLPSLLDELSNFREDPSSPLARHGTGRTTASGLCAWPPAIAWPMQTIEGLLGQAWPGVERGAGSFFSQPAAPRGDAAPAPIGRLASELLAVEWLACARALGIDGDLPAPIARTLATSPLCHASRALTGLLCPAAAGTPAAQLLVPSVLTDGGVPRAILMYSAGTEAVCAPLHGRSSFRILEDGLVEPHAEWPRPISGILALGDCGSIAWNNGTHNWPAIERGYVMYRSSESADVVVEDLPFRPTVGTWWQGRVYWTNLDGGLVSWAPGESAEAWLPELTLLAVHDAGDDLRLDPCARTPDGAYQRIRLPQAWRWRPREAPLEVPLGVNGSTSCRSAGHGWIAAASPNADAVTLRSAQGTTLRLLCHYPFGVAWAGRSLVVGTVDGELLFFADLASVLDQWQARHGLCPSEAMADSWDGSLIAR